MKMYHCYITWEYRTNDQFLDSSSGGTHWSIDDVVPTLGASRVVTDMSAICHLMKSDVDPWSGLRIIVDRWLFFSVESTRVPGSGARAADHCLRVSRHVGLQSLDLGQTTIDN